MTDKDPKDMTASELLREADSYPCSMCRLVMTEDESCETISCESWAHCLADKIDDELAQARELSLLRGAELWAKANGWPDFKPGEDFGQWLDRCTFAKPLDDCGEPVQFDERIVDKVRGEAEVTRISYTANGFYFNNSHNSGGTRIAKRITYAPGERVRRPAPEVLGADGLPLDEDDTVYGTGREQHRYTVQVPYSINEEVGERFCVQCYDHDEGNITWCDPSMLTHERPVLGADGKPIEVGDMARLYISGPVTGIDLRNYPAFRDAQRLLADCGYYADLPHDLVDPGDTHETAMLLCVNELTGRSPKSGVINIVPYYDGVALLPGWEQSEGARLERAVAEACGIPCKTVDEWLEEAR